MTDWDLPLGPFRDPLIARLFGYWNDRRAARIGPARSDIDPIDFPWILADVTLVDVVVSDVAGAPVRFFTRVVGHAIVQRQGFNMTGRWLEDFPEPQFRQIIARSYNSVVRARVPRHGVRDIVLDGRRRRHEVIILPLSADGERVDMLLAALRDLPRSDLSGADRPPYGPIGVGPVGADPP